MSRHLYGLVAAAGAILVSWVALSQPASSSASAMEPPAQRMAPVFRPGIAPVPAGTQGHYELRHLRSRAVFTDRGVEVHLPSRTQPSRTVGWSVAGGRQVRPRAEKPRETNLHRRVGPQKSWESEGPAYGRLLYPGVRPGVDLWFEEHVEGVEYGFRAGRGADLKRVKLEYDGARQVRVVDEGRALEVVLDEGVLREEGLHCAQEEADGTPYAVACRFTDARPVGRERWAYAIEVDVVEPERPVVVDPVIRWSHYLGGSRDDAFGGMAVTDAGEIFVVGTLMQQDLGTGNDIEIDGLPMVSPTAKAVLIGSFHADGGFRGWRALHGGGEDIGQAVTIGKDGMVYVAGGTTSTNFPNLPTYCLNHGAYTPGVGAPVRSDAFVAQFDPKAFKFLGVFLVGTPVGNEVAHGIASGPDGRLYLVGQTSSPVFPGDALAPDAGVDAGVDAGSGGDEEPYDAGVEGGRDGSVDAFVTRLLPSVPSVDTGFTCPGGPEAATLEWSIVGRGSHDDVVYAVALDDAGKVYVTGRTASLGMLPALSVTRQHAGDAGNDDVFVARVDPDAGTVEKSLYLGGLGNEEGRALALKGSGSTSLFVGGTTRSAGFPLITGSGVSMSDAFVVALDKDTFALQGSSTFGGAEGDDEGLALAVDRSAVAGKNIVYLGGRTTSANDFPFVAAFDTRFGAGLTEGFVARLEVDAGAPSWATLVGGEKDDAVLALSNQLPGRLLVGGTTSSSDLAPGTSGGKAPAGEGDLFLLQVDLTADGGTNPGEDAGTDAGEDAGTEAGDDGGTRPDDDAGTGAGEDAGPLRSPLGWSCDASGTSGGPGALLLGILAGLALLARRRTRADRPG
ncbi:MYXO-CTERM sorting domain-containing protein [Archangium gephyra]|uniref:DUF7948 domain-containing protein n=1 Tax=Archangium gephyra TaxID=48 RepID=UPI003B796F95